MINSLFTTKFLAGLSPSREDWVTHLKEAHRVDPSMTPKAFALWHTDEGKTSYQVLADAVPGKDLNVLDLACGDGFLIPSLLPKCAAIVGADMSEGELNVARRQVKDPKVQFVTAEASALPFANEFFDAAVCHMALMLMAPLEDVVRQIARVLKGGGTFSAVIPAREQADGLYELSILFLRGWLRERYPSYKDLRIGDARLGTPEGEILFRAAGFSSSQASDFMISRKVTVDQLWEFNSTMYIPALLPEPEREALRRDFIQAMTPKFDGTEKVLSMPMRLLIYKK